MYQRLLSVLSLLFSGGLGKCLQKATFFSGIYSFYNDFCFFTEILRVEFLDEF